MRGRIPARATRFVALWLCLRVRPASCFSFVGGDGPRRVLLWDTTLRDGAQAEGVSPTVTDKRNVCTHLLDWGVGVVEAGWPGANPKDTQFFQSALGPDGAAAIDAERMAAFCMCRRKGKDCAGDVHLNAVVKSGARRAAMVAKASRWQVEKILGTTAEEGIAMCSDSVAFLSEHGIRVSVDLEHAVDGYRESEAYTVDMALAAAAAGAEALVVCDTNGGAMPWEVEACVGTLRAALDRDGFPHVQVGVHCHNDCNMAVANSIAGVRAGASIVQGCVNGIGERTGNADLCSVAAILDLKLRIPCLGVLPEECPPQEDLARLSRERLRDLTSVSRYCDEILNMKSSAYQPFTGSAAFAHKGGLHVSAVAKAPAAYQHIDPEEVGNSMRILVSDMSGKATLERKLSEWGLGALSAPESASASENILGRLKRLEAIGFSFEGCDASVEMMAKRLHPDFDAPFRVMDFNVLVSDADFEEKRTRIGHEDQAEGPYSNLVTSYWSPARATVKIELPAYHVSSRAVAPATELSCAEGNGPVDALANAVEKALIERFPVMKDICLVDYKVRILDGSATTGSTVRVVVTFRHTDPETAETCEWSTVSADPNILTASLGAICDGLEWAIIKYNEEWVRGA